MPRRSIDPLRGHVNGARYIVKALYSILFQLKSHTGNEAGPILTLPKTLCGPGDRSFPIQALTRTQLHVSVCFEITVKKAQRQSLSGAVGLDPSGAVFSHGRLYVELSRVTLAQKLKIRLPPSSDSQKKM